MEKSCLINQIAFYSGSTGWTEEGRVVGVIHLDFRKTFDTLSHDILTGKLRECRLDVWTVKWFDGCVNARSQGIGISGTGVVGRLSLVVSLKVRYWVHLFNLLISDLDERTHAS